MKKILFAAIIGYTGEVTRDKRVLSTPADGKLKHRPFPLPVMAVINGNRRQIGIIEMAAICDRRIVIFGKIGPEHRNTAPVQGLSGGSLRFELDVDDADAVLDDEHFFRFRSWRLAAVQVGESPCWALPRVVIEELDLKENPINA